MEPARRSSLDTYHKDLDPGRWPLTGRKLRATYRRAGFADMDVDVTRAVDTTGRMRGVIENMVGYGLNFGRITEQRATELRACVDQAINDGTYLAVLPQWWVTGTKASDPLDDEP